jgi:formyltetrahydrofolate-dependent phosphoribosylglycinamide formyltransferase
MSKKTKIAILISGNGSNMQAIVNACENNLIKAEVSLVLSNKKDAKGLIFAKEKNIKTAFIDHKEFLKNSISINQARENFDKKIDEEIEKSNSEFVCLAGFMRILSPWFVNKWYKKMINIHPSLLPEFRGANAVFDAIQTKAKKTGCTIHYVSEEVDAGEIIAQKSVEIFEDDSVETLAARILKEEHKIYVEALKKILN